MKKDDISILVVGAGAVGGIVAAILYRKGYNVVIAAKYPEYAEKIRTEGIHVTGVAGDLLVSLPAVASLSEIKEKKDIILLATKAQDMDKTAREALPLLAEDGYMLSLQNGMCEFALSSITGKDKTVGCIVGWGATMNAPGDLVMTSRGDFIIGYIDREPDEDLNIIAGVLSSVVPVRTTSNIIGHRYSKLIVNSCITSPGAVCGLYLGQMLSIARMRRVFIRIIREAMAVAEAMNIKVEVFGGKLDFYSFIEKSGFMADLKRNITIRVIGYKYRRLKSSSLQSLERGKPTEIPWINGFIVDNGDRFNIPVPVNRKITGLVKLIEEGKADITIKNFDDPLFD